MSAILATRYSDRVEMATDGGVFDQHGNLTGKKSKLCASPSAPLVAGGVGGDGEVSRLTQFAAWATIGRTVDETIDWLAQSLPDRPEVTSPIPFEIVIACLSEQYGPQIWRFRSFHPDRPLPALRLEWLGDVALGPALTVDDMRAAGYYPEDFRRTAIGFMKAMRAKPCRPEFYPGGEIAEGHYVGAHVDHAVITADGVTVERVLEWPDVVGEKIRPDGSGIACPPPQ